MEHTQNWRPTASLERMRIRARALKAIRTFFEQRHVLEVETPALSYYSVTDVHLESLSSEFSNPNLSTATKLHLQTSPEFAMKRLLCAGYGSIYQICKCFRNDESGKLHNPEFTMLEWYRVDFDMQDMIDEVGELINMLLELSPIEQVSYQKVFIDRLNVDPIHCNTSALYTLSKKHGFDLLEDEFSGSHQQYRDTLLQFIFSYLIEPNLGMTSPTIVTHFPISQAALAQPCPEDPDTALRFELYIKGKELANGYQELRDVDTHIERMNLDNAARRSIGLSHKDIDKRFITALEEGLPQCSGVALGFDRLMMLKTNATEIKEVMSFSVDNA